jgi:hypothetical protein
LQKDGVDYTMHFFDEYVVYLARCRYQTIEHVSLMGFTLAFAGRGGRGRFSGGGRGYARGGGDEYNGNRSRSNGYGRVPHQERGILGSHTARN